MRRISAARCSVIFLAYVGFCTLCMAQAANLKVNQQISAEDAAALEEQLKTTPDNLAAREKLIDYYFQAGITSPAPNLEQKRQQHVLWVIEHHPDAGIAGEPEAMIMPIGPAGDMQAYERGKQLWLEQAQKHPGDKRVLRNAAHFFSLFDAKTARDLLQKAFDLDPGDAETASSLAESFEQERILAHSPEEKTALSQKALSIRERALQNADAENRFYELGDIAEDSFEAGDTTKARGYALELLQSSENFKSNWNYGNAVHAGNTVLGQVALQQGDVPAADNYLLEAGKTPGSPQLDSFGPDMKLAKELLEKGERDTVLTYLQSVGKFWKMGGDKLQTWTAVIKAGGAPDFSMNLH